MFKRYAAILITDKEDKVLMGIRKDSGKFANAGGKIEEGEDHYSGAIRELYEETGLTALDIKLVKVEYVKHKKLIIYLFKAIIDPTQETTTEHDPDDEFAILGYFDPFDIIDQLHVPIEDNILIKYWAEN